MRILRVLLAAAPEASRSVPWVVVDASGRRLDGGDTPPPQWPAADRREAVIAADAVRVFALALPPMPASRVHGAAIYALEDRIATPADEVTIAVGPQARDGRVLAVVVARELTRALVDAGFARAIAEPQLAVPIQGWRWCRGETGAFVRTPDGAAFPVSRASGDTMPPELAHALVQAARDGAAPAEVRVEHATQALALDAYAREAGVPFRAGPPWIWDRAGEEPYRTAIDVLAPLRRASVPSAAGKRFTMALAWLGAAVVVHGVATLATFGWTEVRTANLARDLVPLAHRLGAGNATPQTAGADIARIHAQRRHRAGRQAERDAMPLLARASPALAALPAGTIRTASYNAGAWTLELAPLDEPALALFVERLAAAGLTALHARTAAGIRARIAP